MDVMKPRMEVTEFAHFALQLPSKVAPQASKLNAQTPSPRTDQSPMTLAKIGKEHISRRILVPLTRQRNISGTSNNTPHDVQAKNSFLFLRLLRNLSRQASSRKNYFDLSQRP